MTVSHAFVTCHSILHSAFTPSAASLYYIHTDHLGSYNVITDRNKVIRQRFHFDPWGNRMQYLNWGVQDTNPMSITTRGFTGHEHLDEFKIINMKGRLYDPVIARFFSPDPYVQMPDFTQNLNRYAYCLNNPLKYIDPTGEKMTGWDWVSTILFAPARLLTEGSQFVEDKMNGVNRSGGYFNAGYMTNQSEPYSTPATASVNVCSQGSPGWISDMEQWAGYQPGLFAAADGIEYAYQTYYAGFTLTGYTGTQNGKTFTRKKYASWGKMYVRMVEMEREGEKEQSALTWLNNNVNPYIAIASPMFDGAAGAGIKTSTQVINTTKSAAVIAQEMQALNFLKVLQGVARGANIAGIGIGTGIAGYNVFFTGNATIMDKIDFGAGLGALGGAGVAFALGSNPVGWTILGVGGAYFTTRMVIDWFRLD